MKKGLLAVFTGDGKGKTTAALGLAFRALGHGHRVCIIQFIKGKVKTGEAEAAKKHFPNLEFHVLGRGLTWKSDNINKDIETAQKAWEFAQSIIHENRHHMVILDELTYLLRYNMITESEVIEVMMNRPETMHVVITGRAAPPGIVEKADLVTEMKPVKHPYASGVKAQKGFEF